jgi:hypothetical protein
MHVLAKMSWLFGVVLVVSLGGASPAAAYAPSGGGTFNTPNPWGTGTQKYAIVRHVEAAIDATRPTAADPNPVILISTFLFDRGASVDALIAACQRGVSVRVILDQDIDNDQAKRLIQTLNGDNVADADNDGVPDGPPTAGPCNSSLPTDPTVPARRPRLISDAQARRSVAAPTEDSVTWGGDRSYAKKCMGSCRGAGGNMHSKFYAFSSTGSAKDVVMVSSSNLNWGGAVAGWNDLYTMVDRPVSFDAYQRIHRQMTEDTQAGDGKVEVRDGPYTSRFFPMRNASKANDPTLQDLNRVRCHSAFGRTRINVSMFYWDGARGDYLADKVLGLARSGCRVSIIYGAPSVEVAGRLRKAARAGLINLFDSRWDMNNDGYNEVRTHAKYVLVKGRYGTDTSAYEVMTGSQNWVAGSLSRGDETSLNIALRSAYADYSADWERIRQHSRRVPYNR